MKRVRDPQHFFEPSWGIWVQVHKHHVMPIECWGSREKLVDLNTSHVSKPDQGRSIITNHMSYHLPKPIMGRHRHNLHPRRVMRPVLLHEGLVRDPVGKPVQHERPITYYREHLRRDRTVVLDYVGLGDSLFLPHRLVKVGEDYPPPVNLDDFLGPLQTGQPV